MTKPAKAVRCVIVDADGAPLGSGLVARTPPVSRPHIGKHGTAYRMSNGHVRIALDDGSTLYGYECWWTPLPDEPLPST